MPALEYSVLLENAQPEWADAEHTRINISVHFPHLGPSPVRYTAAVVDPGWEHSEEIFARARSGEFGTVSAYQPIPRPVPFDVSRAQLGRAMRKVGLFGQTDAIAFVSGSGIPAALQAIIDGLPNSADRDDAALLFLGASRIERHHPITNLLAAGLGWSDADADDVFRTAGDL